MGGERGGGKEGGGEGGEEEEEEEGGGDGDEEENDEEEELEERGDKLYTPIAPFDHPTHKNCRAIVAVVIGFFGEKRVFLLLLLLGLLWLWYLVLFLG